MKIGIEIHQRLDTHKLFCNCPSSIDEEEKPIGSIKRRLHPVLSEMGEADATSLAEYRKGRTFEYQILKHDCLVETDEEPPSMMNKEALTIALGIANQLHSVPVDEIHTMRKLVIDGSNTSGFQRTAIIAMNGHVSSSKGTVGIQTLMLEEESSGIVSNTETGITYRLDRLGVPLIEIATAPDIKNGAHLKEVAEKIGMILRATGKVARGLGTIRQDVNISTEGGARVEIKGAQDLKMLPTIAEQEEKRQTELVKLIFELRERKAFRVVEVPKDVTRAFENTKSPLIQKGLAAQNAIVLGLRMPHHAGLLGREIQQNRRYGSELSDYAKAAGVKGVIHSDENLEKYQFAPSEIEFIRQALDIREGSDDAFILVVAPKAMAERAIDLVIMRANFDFIPMETRKANPDGTSSFMRSISGKARLYPETDVPPVQVTEDLIAAASEGESLEEKKSKLETLLNKEMAATMLKSRNLHLFEKLVEQGVDPTLAATTLENTIVSLRREGIEFSDLETTLLDLFSEYKKDAFVKAAIPDVLKGMAKGARVEAVLKVFRLQKITGPALEKLAAEEKFNMQAIMQKYRLQVDPAEVAKVIKKSHNEDPDYR